jgi:hypothetical protein
MIYSLESISNGFLAECREDYVGLWKLIWRIGNETRETDPDTIRSLAIALLTNLLNKGLIKAGMPNATGEFEEWRASPDEIIRRIEARWDRLGKEPDIGDVVWFTTTEKGDVESQSRIKQTVGSSSNARPV